MKVSLTVTDERPKRPAYSYQANPDMEDYERIVVVDFSAPAAVIASTLRGIADDIAPMPDKSPGRVFVHVNDEVQR